MVSFVRWTKKLETRIQSQVAAGLQTGYSVLLPAVSFFLSFFRYCTTPSRGLHAGGLRLKATVQKVYRKRKEKDDRVKKNIQEELKEG